MTVVKELAKGKLYAEFDSVSDVYRVIDRLKWEPKKDKASDTPKSQYGGGFYTFNNLSHAREVFEHNPESIREFSANDDRLVRPESPGKDVSFDITGDFLDIDRHLAEEPEQFGNAIMGNPKNIFCTINVLAIYVSYTENSYLLQRQKRILRLVDWLESQGVRCQIVATMDNHIAYISTLVKQYQDPFNLNDLAVVSHGDWLRRLEFLIMEQSKTWSGGYGEATEYDNRMFDYKPEPEDGMYIYVGGYSPYSSVKELDKAFDELEAKVMELVDLGIPWNDEPFTVGDRRRNRNGW